MNLSLPFNPGERLILSFRGPSLTPFMKKMLSRGLCGGIIFFSSNYENRSQFVSLVEEIRKMSLVFPPLLAIDQEGGRVQRIREEDTILPPAREMGDVFSTEKIFKSSLSLGKSLLARGIQVDFAPVLDVLTNPANSVIGDRAFGSDAGKVAEKGTSFMEGLLASGILPVVKHFPGHGMTYEDSHEILPRTEVEAEEIEQTHLYPFSIAARKGVPGIMTAHVLYENIDPHAPATFSRHIIIDILRARLGFSGALFSDDLNMRAIRDNFSPQDIASRAAESAPDFLVLTGEENIQEELVEELQKAYEKAKRKELEAFHGRARKFRSLLPG